MKVLVVLSQPPLPEGGAPGRCAVALLRGLTAHGLDVKAIAARLDAYDCGAGNDVEQSQDATNSNDTDQNAATLLTGITFPTPRHQAHLGPRTNLRENAQKADSN